MKNETKLTAADLAMYFGAECEYQLPHTPEDEVINTHITAREINNINLERYTYFKPILRPLSDMTEEEAMELAGFFGAQSAMSTQLDKADFARRLMGNDYCSPQSVRYLLSRNFDLFGWIEAGLAIDKTKI
jgi:hypothetical protein